MLVQAVALAGKDAELVRLKQKTKEFAEKLKGELATEKQKYESLKERAKIYADEMKAKLAAEQELRTAAQAGPVAALSGGGEVGSKSVRWNMPVQILT